MTFLARQMLNAVLQAAFLLGAALMTAREVAERAPEWTLHAGVAAVLLAGLVLCRPPNWERRGRAPSLHFRDVPGTAVAKDARRTLRTRDGCVWKPMGGSRGTRLMRYGCATCGQVGYAAIGTPPLECLKGRKVPRL